MCVWTLSDDSDPYTTVVQLWQYCRIRGRTELLSSAFVSILYVCFLLYFSSLLFRHQKHLFTVTSNRYRLCATLSNLFKIRFKMLILFTFYPKYLCFQCLDLQCLQNINRLTYRCCTTIDSIDSMFCSVL